MNSTLLNHSTDLFDNDYVVIGKVGRIYGIRGWLKIHSFTNPSSNILTYDSWYLLQQSQWQLVEVTQCKPHSKAYVAHFAHCHSPEAARLLTNCLIGIKRSQLPVLSADEYYWSDLMGLAVYNTENIYLGTIESLLETGANDVLVVKNNDKEVLIPYVLHHFVITVDLAAHKMVVDWQEDY